MAESPAYRKKKARRAKELCARCGESPCVCKRTQATEQALKASEERMRLALQAAHIGTFERDVRTGLITWSAELDCLYGLVPGTFNGTATDFFVNLVHPDDRARLVELVESALKTGQSTDGEWRAVWPDGSVHWIAGRWQVFMNESGQASRMIGINVDVTERKLAEEALRESEQRLRLATEVGRMYAYDWDVATNVVVRSSEHLKVLGLTEALDSPQQHFVDKIHPDDRARFLAAIAALSPEKPTGEITYRSLASGRTEVWVKSNGRGFFDAEGRLLRVIGMVADVTDLKLAEESLAGMTRKLIEAQEQERTRIARDLHDDIGQRLSLLAIELDSLRQRIEGIPPEVLSDISELLQLANSLTTDVQTMSHSLHPARLEILGLVAAMKSTCREFSQQHSLEIDFESHDSYLTVPSDVSLALFRVLQEALRNASKHSGVKHVQVELRETSSEIHLIVSDSGRGFDLNLALQGQGLGLTSMQERVRLVNGTITIQSESMGGTKIQVRVPIHSQQSTKRAVG